MSLFDDTDDTKEESYHYEANDEFQVAVLQNARKLDEHPVELIAMRQVSALDAIEDFISQEPLVSKKERVAIESDIEEAREALHRAYRIMPPNLIEEEQ